MFFPYYYLADQTWIHEYDLNSQDSQNKLELRESLVLYDLQDDLLTSADHLGGNINFVHFLLNQMKSMLSLS